MAKVILRNIYKKYEPSRGGITAVSDFNLSIEDKEFLVLFGPSVCGKSMRWFKLNEDPAVIFHPIPAQGLPCTFP